MKALVMTIALLVVLPVFAQIVDSKSERMITLLETAGVGSYGKRETMSGSFFCKTTVRKGTEIVCTLRGDFGYDEDSIYKKFENEEAKAVSALLIEFGSRPYDKRLRQEAYIECRLPRQTKVGEKTCELVEFNYISN